MSPKSQMISGTPAGGSETHTHTHAQKAAGAEGDSGGLGCRALASPELNQSLQSAPSGYLNLGGPCNKDHL